MKNLVIGVAGPMDSGKGTVAQYILKCYPGTKVFRFSDSLREFYAWLHADFLATANTMRPRKEASTRELQTLSTAVRQIFGEDSLERAIMKKARRALGDGNLVVIEGIRRLVDIKGFVDAPDMNFRLIYVDAEPAVRYARHIARDEKPGDAELTLGEFLAIQNAEAETQITQLAPRSDAQIENDGTLVAFEQKIQALLHEWTV